jgi:hypothetical protein
MQLLDESENLFQVWSGKSVDRFLYLKEEAVNSSDVKTEV